MPRAQRRRRLTSHSPKIETTTSVVKTARMTNSQSGKKQLQCTWAGAMPKLLSVAGKPQQGPEMGGL